MRTLFSGLPLRSPPALLVILVTSGAVCVALPATAQVTTNRGALDALGSSGHASTRHAATRPTAHHHAVAQPAHARSHPAGRSSRPTGTHPPAATIPAAPPPPPVFRAPVINVPLHPPPPPPPVPVVQTATGAATALGDGTRLTFGAGTADLNPTTMQALHDFSSRLKADPDARADIDATSSGTPDDPSTPRRVALSRGLAARAVLINDGIPSTRIYVRVLGQVTPAPGGADASAPPDRVDLRLSQAAGATPPATTPPSVSTSPDGSPLPGTPAR